MSSVIGGGANQSLHDGSSVPADAPVHLAQLNTEALRTARLSPDGKWLAFATLDKFKLYSVEVADFNVQLTRVISTFVSFFVSIFENYLSKKKFKHIFSVSWGVFAVTSVGVVVFSGQFKIVLWSWYFHSWVLRLSDSQVEEDKPISIKAESVRCVK